MTTIIGCKRDAKKETQNETFCMWRTGKFKIYFFTTGCVIEEAKKSAIGMAKVLSTMDPSTSGSENSNETEVIPVPNQSNCLVHVVQNIRP